MGREIDVSIILPVYNETARLVSGLSAILEYLDKSYQLSVVSGQKKAKRKQLYRQQTTHNPQRFNWEIVMVDDGSNIPAAEVINHSYLKKQVTLLSQKKRFRGYRLEQNMGKGKAISIGVHHAKGNHIIFMDIDGSVSIRTLPLFLKQLETSEIAIGSRRIPKSTIAVHQPLLRETGGRLYTFLSKTFFGLSVHDLTCGFKAFRHDAAKRLFSRLLIHRWAFDTEIVLRAKIEGFRVTEVPVVWSNKQGSKVTLAQSVGSFVDLLKLVWYQSEGAFAPLPQSSQRLDQPVAKEKLLCDVCKQKEFTFLFHHHNDWKVQRCITCGLVQVAPLPKKADVAALYHNDSDHFSPYIEQEQVHRKYFREKLSVVSRQLSAIKLLDVGCLTGVLLDEAWKLGMRAEGIDISNDAVLYCMQKGLTAHHGTIHSFLRKNPRKKFTVVTAFEIIEHEYNPRALVEGMYKALHRDGVAMVSTPNHGSWWRSFMGKKWPGYTHPEHLYFFDSSSLEFLFREVGFRDITITTGDSRPFPLWFLFKRGVDYFPTYAPVLRMLATVTRLLPLRNPINPWDDLLIVAKK